MTSKLWTESFGDDYHERNTLTEEQSAARLTFFLMLATTLADGGKKALPKSILEVGAGTGHNLKAIKKIIDSNGLNIKLGAIEPNATAGDELIANLEGITLYRTSLPMDSAFSYEMVFTCGMLIHISPKWIEEVMQNIYDLSSKYILIMEYFSPEEREINYRGHDEALWTRDYGSLFMTKFKLHCIGYGFLWKPITLFDNITWWLLEKTH